MNRKTREGEVPARVEIAKLSDEDSRAKGSSFGPPPVALEMRALEIWDVIESVDASYDWGIGEKARQRLNTLLGRKLECWGIDDASELNRSVRTVVGDALHDRQTTAEQAGELYDWIVAEWGGVRSRRDVVRAWAGPSFGWHGAYDDRTLLAFADRLGQSRASSWSKIFAFAAPDRHAIYDSRVAVALNLALEGLGEPDRFFMPMSRVKRRAIGTPYRRRIGTPLRSRISGEARSHQRAQRVAAG